MGAILQPNIEASAIASESHPVLDKDVSAVTHRSHSVVTH